MDSPAMAHSRTLGTERDQEVVITERPHLSLLQTRGPRLVLLRPLHYFYFRCLFISCESLFTMNCLGALDGMHIKVTVPTKLKGRYMSRKADIVTNVLGVCAPDMQFIHILPGWKGSARDGCVLRDAISRPDGLQVPQGCYYLVDAGYTNANGFLVPYRGQRYHLGGWTAQNPPCSAE